MRKWTTPFGGWGREGRRRRKLLTRRRRKGRRGIC